MKTKKPNRLRPRIQLSLSSVTIRNGKELAKRKGIGFSALIDQVIERAL